MTLQERFDSFLTEILPEDACRVLLAVSGGVDSVSMASLFASSSHSISFAVAHMNFSLRGAESDGDERFVGEWCKDHGVRLFTRKVDTLEYASQHRVSVEMAARELRYAWFAELCDAEGFDFVSVAHNLNDSVETMYLNMVRGAGLRGLSGIRPVNGRIIRPLLEFSRAEIESYAAAQGLKWRTDSTNKDVTFSRNRLRNNVLPELVEINPSLLETSRKEARRFARQDQLLSREFESHAGELFTREGDVLKIDIGALASDEFADCHLFRLLEPLGFNDAVQEEILHCIKNPRTGKKFISGKYIALIDRGFIKVYDASSAEEPSVSWRIYPKTEGFDPKALEAGCLCVDADKVSMPLTVREPLPGDRFVPFGMKGSRLLSDFFTDLKLDRVEKSRQRVVVDASGAIVCVAGRRPDNRFRIDSSSKNILEIRYSVAGISSSAV